MFRKQPFRILLPLLLIAVLALSGCAQLIQPVRTSGSAPTPVVSFSGGGVDDPNVFVEPEAFQKALLLALAARDTTLLQKWMTEPFLTGTWRGETAGISPAEAVKSLFADQLAAQPRLGLVKNADLKALMGGKDPLSIPGGEAGVIEAYLVSGWGLDGRDEAILFVSRRANNSLKWHGWMRVKGGFSGARLGGIQPYQNDALGFSLYLPKDFQVSQPVANQVSIVAPQVEGGGHPGLAIIQIEPVNVNGRSAEQIAKQVFEETRTQMGAGWTGSLYTGMNIDGEQSFVVNHMPGQDFNRQLFMVHDDLLYLMTFIPDDPQAGASSYNQMEDAYAMIVNTFRFTK